MIVTGGLTPAWQRILVFDRFQVGEVNRALEVHELTSGKALNVAIGAAHLGAETCAVAPIGGPAREPIELEMETLNVRGRFIATIADTRECVTIVDKDGRATTELVENAGKLTPDELDQFCEVFEDEARGASAIVLSGSLSAGAPKDLYRRLLTGQTAPSIVDARGPELLETLSLRPFLVKPNRQELAATAGGAFNGEADLLRAMRELCERGAQWTLVTDGPRAAYLANPTKAWKLLPAPLEAIINPIASGDSLAAAFACAIAKGASALEAAREGMAAARQNAATLLPARLNRSANWQLPEVEELQ